MPQKRQPITVYLNPHGDVVIRQQAAGGDSSHDQVVVLTADHVPVLVAALADACAMELPPA